MFATNLLLNGWDWVAITLFFVILVGIAGFCSRRPGRDANDFFLSKRSMPWWLIGVSMCAATTSVACTCVYALMFAAGYRIYGRTGVASSMTALAVIAGAALVPILRQLNRNKS